VYPVESPSPPAFFSWGRRCRRRMRGVDLAEQRTIYMNGRWETHENTQLQRENRPLIRLRHLLPPQETAGGEGLSTRGVVVLQERCVRCGVGSVPRQRHCNHGSSCDMVVRRRWRWIGARHATSPIAFLHLHQVARDFHFHLSSMLGRLPEPLTRYKTRDVGRRQALGRFADKTLDERLPSSRFRSLPGEF